MTKPATIPALRIRSTRPEGFRRAGRRFGVAPQDIPLEGLDEGQIEALENEPNLFVERLAIEAPECGQPEAAERPLGGLSIKELKALAPGLTPPVDLSGARSKGDILKAFEAAGYRRADAAPPADDATSD